MRKYRVKAVDPDTYYPQYSVGPFWLCWSQDEFFGGSSRVQFTTLDEAESYIQRQHMYREHEAEAERIRKRDYPQYFPWPRRAVDLSKG